MIVNFWEKMEDFWLILVGEFVICNICEIKNNLMFGMIYKFRFLVY